MKTITRIAIITITLGWFPFMWLCLFGFKQPAETRMIITMIGLITCLFGSLMSLLGGIGNNSFWLSLKQLEEKIKAYDDAKKAYQLAEKRLINTTLELERDKSKYNHNKVTEDEILKIIKQESEIADVRKYT